MRSTNTRKFLAAAYGLGLIWTVAMVGGSVVLAQPMLELYNGLGIESAAVHVALTMSLVMLLASVVTVAVALVVRAVASQTPVHRPTTPRVATHHA